MEYVAIGVGTSGNAYVHNPLADLYGGATIHPEFTIPSSLHKELKGLFGGWPEEQLPNTPRYKKAADIFIDYVLGKINPEVALIWSSEPDKSQHAFGVGSDAAKAALREADLEFGRVMEYIRDSSQHQNSDLMILSDHGYSTISEVINIETLLESSNLAGSGGWLLAQNGGCALFYLKNQKDVHLVPELVEWLSSQVWCGTLCSSERLGKVKGTIPLSSIMNEGKRSPDIIMSFNWDSTDNVNGYSGHVFSTGGAKNLGQHGSMSLHEMNNTLICCGPTFLESEKILSPSGNIDILPTILTILGQDIPDHVEGRVLEESFRETNSEVISVAHKYDASLTTNQATYFQEITVSFVGDSKYIDEGNSWLGK
jgi:arylsulfatase A-like enzyme